MNIQRLAEDPQLHIVGYLRVSDLVALSVVSHPMQKLALSVINGMGLNELKRYLTDVKNKIFELPEKIENISSLKEHSASLKQKSLVSLQSLSVSELTDLHTKGSCPSFWGDIFLTLMEPSFDKTSPLHGFYLSINQKFLVTTGKVSRAIRWGCSLKQESPDASRCNVARLLIAEKNFEEAEKVANIISDIEMRDSIWRSLAIGLNRSDHWEKAWEVTMRSSRINRGDFLTRSLTGRLDDAEKVRYVVGIVQKTPNSSGILDHIAYFLDGKGPLEELEALAPDAFRSGLGRRLKEKCKTLIAENNFEEAEKVVKSLPGNPLKQPILPRLVQALMESNDPERAAKLVNDIFTDRDSQKAFLDHLEHTSNCLMRTARFFNSLATVYDGQTMVFKKLIESSNSSELEEVVNVIASILSDNGMHPSTKESVLRAVFKYDRSWIIKLIIDNDRDEWVESLTRALINCGNDQVWKVLASSWTKFGVLARRAGTIGSISDMGIRDYGLESLARALAESGNRDRAKGIADAISGREKRSRVFVELDF